MTRPTSMLAAGAARSPPAAATAPWATACTAPAPAAATAASRPGC